MYIRANISRTKFFNVLTSPYCFAKARALTNPVCPSTSQGKMLYRILWTTLLPALLNPLLAAAGICTECGVNGYYYKEPGCFNITYEAPLFGADAGACFEIGGPYSPFGESGPCRSVEIILAAEGCECMYQGEQICEKGKGAVRY